MFSHLRNHPSDLPAQPRSDTAARIIVQTLKLTKNGELADIGEIARKSGTNHTFAARVVQDLVSLDTQARAALTTEDRFKLASAAFHLGVLEEAAEELTWQEFEKFSQDCFRDAGFDTRKGLIVRDSSRRWQIDLVARKNSIILAVDCKHWGPPNHPSKLRKPAEHQRSAIRILVHKMQVDGVPNCAELTALPMLLTLYEPPVRTLDEVALVPIAKLPDFLNNINLYQAEMPFISFQKSMESSMRETPPTETRTR